MKCIKCGSKIRKNFKLCPNCGEEIIINKKNKKFAANKFNMIIAAIIGLSIITIVLFMIMNTGYSIKTIRKSVVKINVYNKSGDVIQTGSGFIVFNKNILVTNAHVITGGVTADAISEDDEKIYIDGAIYYNQDEDIAILKLNNQNSIKPLKIMTKYNSGDKVIVIGSPLGIKNSVSDGIISNILEDKTIQHTAPISHGSSGGTLFNSKGEVIGMNTASIISGQNINLAIPIGKIVQAYDLSKKSKVKTLQKIQYGDNNNMKSIMLNNNAGKDITKLINTETDNRYAIRNKINDIKSIPVYKTLYDYRSYISDILIIWGADDIEESDDGLKRTLIKESTINEIILIKLNSREEDLKKLVKTVFVARSDELYDSAKDCFWYCYSYDYIEATRNPKIGFVNDYAYMIIAKNKDFIEKLENYIKKLP